jgi:hypothetical protein
MRQLPASQAAGERPQGGIAGAGLTRCGADPRGRGDAPAARADPENTIGANRDPWAELRAEMEERRQRRVERRRFRRDSEGYLRLLEAKLIQPSLPT